MDGLPKFAELEVRQQEYIDYCSMGGMTIDDEGKIGKLTADDFAKRYEITRQGLQKWQNSIPGFWEYVKQRRNVLYSQSAMTLIYKAMLKKAAQGDVQAAKLVMNQAKVLEADKQDITSGGKPIPILGGISALHRDDSSTETPDA